MEKQFGMRVALALFLCGSLLWCGPDKALAQEAHPFASRSAPTQTPGTGAQPAASPTPPATPFTGLKFGVVLDQSLVSGHGNAGDQLRFVVNGAVWGPNNTILIPAGTILQGTLLESVGATTYGRPGKLRFECNTLIGDNQQRIPVKLVESTNKVGREVILTQPFYDVSLVCGLVSGYLAYTALQQDGNHEQDIFGRSIHDSRPAWRGSGRFLLAGVGIGIVGTAVKAVFGPFVRGRNVSILAGTHFVVEAIP